MRNLKEELSDIRGFRLEQVQARTMSSLDPKQIMDQ
jgi:hypothetical protein